MSEEFKIADDRMRFPKNTTSSRLALLAIVFDVLYFISIYKSDVGTYYYNIMIGASVVYNLIFLLATFLCSEGVKNYKRSYSKLMIVLGILQIARIFILPASAHSTVVGEPIESIWQVFNVSIPVSVANTVMSDGQFIRVSIYLVLSAICLFASAVINNKKSSALEAHIANLGLDKA